MATAWDEPLILAREAMVMVVALRRLMREGKTMEEREAMAKRFEELIDESRGDVEATFKGIKAD